MAFATLGVTGDGCGVSEDVCGLLMGVEEFL